MSRLDALMADDMMEPAGMALVGMPEDEDAGGASLPFSTSSTRGLQSGDGAEEEITRQVACMQLPPGMEKHQKLGPLLDSLEPCLSGADSRLGLRQMHLAWTSNCTCAKSSVMILRIAPCSLFTKMPASVLPVCGLIDESICVWQVLALEQLGRLRQQAKGRQVRRVEEQVKSFADVVQSGMPKLGCTEIATVLEVIQNRSGHDTLFLFVSALSLFVLLCLSVSVSLSLCLSPVALELCGAVSALARFQVMQAQRCAHVHCTANTSAMHSGRKSPGTRWHGSRQRGRDVHAGHCHNAGQVYGVVGPARYDALPSTQQFAPANPARTIRAWEFGSGHASLPRGQRQGCGPDAVCLCRAPAARPDTRRG